MALISTMAMNPPAAQAVGDSATKYNLFVPANVMTSRPSYLVVTNIAPVSNTVDIEDDAADGDSDDSAFGITLAPGDSYIVRIKDGAVNDDAGGKWDGDYFKVRASHAVSVFMGSGSSWEHDWVPSVGKSGIGTSFYIYSLPGSGSPADVNVFAYEDDTAVTITDITTNTVSASGKAVANLASRTVLLRTMLQQGEDLNVRHLGLGLDILQAGHSYAVRTTRPVTVQTGHLGAISGGNQARDGGGYVPSSNGSSVGSLFFLGIPHELGLAREKELRIVCPSAATVSLWGSNYGVTSWNSIAQSSVAAGGHLDFVGASNPSFLGYELYKLAVSPSYIGCSVYEANWMETGSPGTSDSASVVSSDEGQGLGYRFAAYIGPPGASSSTPLAGPLTNNPNPSGGFASHLWVYATQNNTGVTISDIDRGGSLIRKEFQLQADQYYDFIVDRSGYQALTASGVRPYLRIQASQPVTVVSGNVNDNWLTYFNSVIAPTPVAKLTATSQQLSCGETATLTLRCSNEQGSALSDLTARLRLPAGLQPVAGSFTPTETGSTSGSVTWQGGTLAAGGMAEFSVAVQLSCAALGCTPADLRSVQAECTGLSAGQTYAGSDESNFTLQPSSGLTVVRFAVQDVPDYLASMPSPHVTIELQLSGDSTATASLERVVGSALPQATPTVLATYTGPQTVTVNDSYAQHYEETRYYRLRITEGACSRLVGPMVLATSSGQSSGLAGGLESNGRMASQLARRAIARSTWAEQHLRRGEQAVRQAALDTPAPSPLLLRLLPTQGPDGARRVDATPTDLPGLTNAKSVAAADYLDDSGQRVASLLLVETQGEVYEHSKMLCDRAGGSVLDRVDEQGMAPSGAFLRTLLRDERHHTGESAVEFKAYEGPL